jgi:hypothetical protein
MIRIGYICDVCSTLTGQTQARILHPTNTPNILRHCLKADVDGGATNSNNAVYEKGDQFGSRKKKK